jgi:hypothetical protein
MSEKRKKIPLIYVPYGILQFDDLTICQNPELVTGTKDSLCVPWGKKCKILHCWTPKGQKESDWVRGEVQYLVEIEPPPAMGRCSRRWFISWWSGYVYAMSEDSELDPVIIVTSKEQLDRETKRTNINK